ncbi:hypothetical protein TNIN_429011 [Trichonephila inaurata madagascariensis]|uniref:Uncharacterized protein n=1 Tax=Trichonephila inaurata madagascariensis TaxID=2747483 RepID=A0A8X7CE42_9ARAC|nr:hypothetical protein TNIN_429011 [Trichonephila inaurata madagascariensis]
MQNSGTYHSSSSVHSNIPQMRMVPPSFCETHLTLSKRIHRFKGFALYLNPAIGMCHWQSELINPGKIISTCIGPLTHANICAL